MSKRREWDCFLFADGKLISYDRERLRKISAANYGEYVRVSDMPVESLTVYEIEEYDQGECIDPSDWLVNEFRAGCLKRLDDGSRICWINLPNDEEEGGLITYFEREGWWYVMGEATRKPLTRADVARLCELFGVEVKR